MDFRFCLKSAVFLNPQSNNNFGAVHCWASISTPQFLQGLVFNGGDLASGRSPPNLSFLLRHVLPYYSRADRTMLTKFNPAAAKKTSQKQKKRPHPLPPPTPFLLHVMFLLVAAGLNSVHIGQLALLSVSRPASSVLRRAPPRLVHIFCKK